MKRIEEKIKDRKREKHNTEEKNTEEKIENFLEHDNDVRQSGTKMPKLSKDGGYRIDGRVSQHYTASCCCIVLFSTELLVETPD
jgi:IS5 family transposase